MTDTEIVTKLATEVCGFSVSPHEPTPGNPIIFHNASDRRYYYPLDNAGWNPLEKIEDARMVEDVIANWPLPKRQKYINALYNDIVGSLAIVGTTKLYWGLIHATARQRSMAALAAVTEGKNEPVV